MADLHDRELKKLEEVANQIRVDVIKMLSAAGSGHAGGSLGMADVFTAFYFNLLRHRPKNPEWPERDRLILSNGHICPVRYAAMARAGYFPPAELKTLRKLGSRLQGHPERFWLPGVETTSGPLGAGLAQAAGLAYAAKMDGKKWRTYCLVSDAEQAVGLHWEAALFAAKYKLSNLTCVIDRNNIQIDGPTEEVMPIEPLAEKYRAFNWHVLEVNGNDIRAVIEAVEEAKTIVEKPTVIVAHTVPGRGVSFIEGKYEWHGRVTKPGEETKAALAELEAIGAALRAGHRK